MKPRSLVVVALSLMALSLSTFALHAQATLKHGDPAPALKTGAWIQGEPVGVFEADKVYLVEFWATWCGPCGESIPHLNELHLKFKDKGLVVIGQNVFDTDQSLVKPFVEKMGDKMTYRVALDDKEGAMGETWLKAADQNGIPTAFLVGKDGRIAWIGHPSALKESLIEEVLAGTFDVAKAGRDFQTEQATKPLWRQFNSQMRDKKYEEANATIEEISKLMPEAERHKLDGARVIVLLGRGDVETAAVVADKFTQLPEISAQNLNGVACELLRQQNLSANAIAIGHRIAMRANQAAEGKNPDILDTLAVATFLKGDKEQALALQEKALALAPADHPNRKFWQDRLESYKAGKLPKFE